MQTVVTTFQEMLDSLHDVVDLTTGILDCNGKILVASGWREICMRFHRANPLTEVENSVNEALSKFPRPARSSM